MAVLGYIIDNLKDPGEREEAARILEALAEASAKFKWAYIIAIVGEILLLILALLVLGSLFGIGMIAASTESPDALIAALAGSLIILLILMLVLLVAVAYLVYSGAKVLKSVTEHSTNPVALQLRTPAQLLYYGVLLVLIGVVTLIVLVGAILILVGLLLWLIGFILLGSNLKSLGPKYNGPGNLILVAGLLYVVNMFVSYTSFGGILGIIAAVIAIYAFHELEKIARADAMLLRSQPGTVGGDDKEASL